MKLHITVWETIAVSVGGDRMLVVINLHFLTVNKTKQHRLKKHNIIEMCDLQKTINTVESDFLSSFLTHCSQSSACLNHSLPSLLTLQ